jgi:uncharacterized protein
LVGKRRSERSPAEHAEAVVLFVKAPVPGRCKTRLVPPLSPEDAAALYRAFSRDTFASLRALHRPLWIAYEPHATHPTPAWLARGIPFFKQRGANLGDKLVHAFRTLFARGFRRVTVLGTDSPTLPARRVAGAFGRLRRHEAVIGPARDGGYYLIALSRPRPALFRGIPWSTDRVTAETRKILARDKISAAFLPAHYDVDSPADLQRLARDLRRHRRSDFCRETRRQLKRLGRTA